MTSSSSVKITKIPIFLESLFLQYLNHRSWSCSTIQIEAQVNRSGNVGTFIGNFKFNRCRFTSVSIKIHKVTKRFLTWHVKQLILLERNISQLKLQPFAGLVEVFCDFVYYHKSYELDFYILGPICQLISMFTNKKTCSFLYYHYLVLKINIVGEPFYHYFLIPTYS